jgi:hypothetical protein
MTPHSLGRTLFFVVFFLRSRSLGGSSLRDLVLHSFDLFLCLLDGCEFLVKAQLHNLVLHHEHLLGSAQLLNHNRLLLALFP